MFKKERTDRRGGYSFRGHFRRAVQTKGVGRIALSLTATAIIAGTAFANCSSSDITGPRANTTLEATTDAVSTTSPTTSATSTTKEGPVKLPVTTIPPSSPCTAQPIAWDKMFTLLQGTTQITAEADRFHAQFHLNSVAQGITDTETAPGASVRRYTGSEQFNSQILTILANSTEKVQFEWNMKIIAKGEDGTLFPEDDFFLHVVSRFGPPPLFTPEEVTMYGRCR